MDWKKKAIDEAIIKVATIGLEYVLEGVPNRDDIKHRALNLYQDCSQILGYVGMGYWANVLTREEYEEYHDLVYDMVNDAHHLAYFGEFI